MLEYFNDYRALADAVGLVITLAAIVLIIIATVRVRRFDKLVKHYRASACGACEVETDRRRALPGDTVPCPSRRLSDRYVPGRVYVMGDANRFVMPDTNMATRRDQR